MVGKRKVEPVQVVTEDEKTTSILNRLAWILLICVLFPLYSLIIIYGLGESDEILLSTGLILGVVALIFALALMALVFRRVGLANENQSLGLPEGSIRAIIALSLILIFMISSMFIYSQIQTGGTKEYNYDGVTQEQIDNISKTGDIVSIVRLNVTNENNQMLFNVVQLVSTSNTAATDIAKQIITTVSTLVVAVSGFYFGSRAGEGSKAGGGEDKGISTPVIGGIETDTYTVPSDKDEETFPIIINGKNFISPKVELHPKSGDPIEVSGVLSNSSRIEGFVKITKDTPIGKWTLVVTNSDKGEHKLKDLITVSKSPLPENKKGVKVGPRSSKEDGEEVT